MKQIPLTQGKFAIVDDNDFEYLSQWKWSYLSCSNGGYARRVIYVGKIDGKNKQECILMHRVINNTPDGFQTDHINENKLDNRRENLRTATCSQNQMNKGKQKNNTSGTRGIGWHKSVKAWAANIGIGGKSTHIGYFNTKKDAEIAYKNVAQFLYGEFASGGAS
jgi:hypothetical protein